MQLSPALAALLWGRAEIPHRSSGGVCELSCHLHVWLLLEQSVIEGFVCLLLRLWFNQAGGCLFERMRSLALAFTSSYSCRLLSLASSVSLSLLYISKVVVSLTASALSVWCRSLYMCLYN